MPSSIQHALDEMPISLDETYAHALQEIPKEKWEHAHRLFQCLVAAVRPLQVEELGEVFAIQFGTDRETAFKLEERWRPENAEDAVLSACSTLITIVSDEDSKIVQFAHFSVKEFLTSNRLATMDDRNTSRYHIGLEPAHTVLAQACFAELLHLEDKGDKDRLGALPLAFYAAENWVKHAQFGMVASQVGDGMERLFDPTKAHFAAWTGMSDIDLRGQSLFRGFSESLMDDFLEYLTDDFSEDPTDEFPENLTGDFPEYYMDDSPARARTFSASPLYDAALCGFRSLAEYLIGAHAQDVNAEAGRSGFPLTAAEWEGHLGVVRLLSEHRADTNARDCQDISPLHVALSNGDLETMQYLLECGAKVNARDEVRSRWTPLVRAANFNNVEAMRLLLLHGADVGLRDHQGRCALHTASSAGKLEAVQFLLEHHADVNASNHWDSTPLHYASFNGHANVVRLLLKWGAYVDPRDRSYYTPLFLASCKGNLEVVRIVLGCGADVQVRNSKNETPLQAAIARGYHEIVKLFLEHGAEREQEDIL
jgi:ankyrin repeat protein